MSSSPVAQFNNCDRGLNVVHQILGCIKSHVICRLVEAGIKTPALSRRGDELLGQSMQRHTKLPKH